MPTNRVRVRAKPGRVVREAPRGDFIPSDRFVQVPLTSYIRRLIYHFGDLELEPEAAHTPTKSKKAVTPAWEPEAPSDKETK